MPLYGNRANAVNIMDLDESLLKYVYIGNTIVVESLIDALEAKHTTGIRSIAIDGWYGVHYAALATLIRVAAKKCNLSTRIIMIADIFKTSEELNTIAARYETDDPGFGWVNDTDSISNLFYPPKLVLLQKSAASQRLELGDSDSGAVWIGSTGTCRLSNAALAHLVLHYTSRSWQIYLCE